MGKVSSVSIILILIMAVNSWAFQDTAYRRLVSAMHNKDMTEFRLNSFVEEYKGQEVKGEGYVSEVIRSAFSEALIIYVYSTEEHKSKYDTYDVVLPIPSYEREELQKARKLKEGQKIFFDAKLRAIDTETRDLHFEDVKLYPK